MSLVPSSIEDDHLSGSIYCRFLFNGGVFGSTIVLFFKK